MLQILRVYFNRLRSKAVLGGFYALIESHNRFFPVCIHFDD